MNDIFFLYPMAFILIPVFITCAKFCPPKSGAIIFPTFKFLNQINIIEKNWTSIFKWLAIIFLIVTMASPYKILTLKSDPKVGLNIALVLDTSDSMRAGGFHENNPVLNRFEVVKKIVMDFITKREGDNLGLVVFAEYAFVASPLTFDREILREIVGNMHIGIAGKSTALYDSIGQSVSLLKDENNSTNIAIILTDGINTAGNIKLEDAIKLAKKYKIKIYTIGIGREGEINPFELEEIAVSTGGQFFIARSNRELEEIYNQIDLLEKREIKDREHEIKEYLYFYPLLLSLIFLTFAIVIKNKNEF